MREFQEELGAAIRPVRRVWTSITRWQVELAWWLGELDAERATAAQSGRSRVGALAHARGRCSLIRSCSTAIASFLRALARAKSCSSRDGLSRRATGRRSPIEDFRVEGILRHEIRRGVGLPGHRAEHELAVLANRAKLLGVSTGAADRKSDRGDVSLVLPPEPAPVPFVGGGSAGGSLVGTFCNSGRSTLFERKRRRRLFGVRHQVDPLHELLVLRVLAIGEDRHLRPCRAAESALATACSRPACRDSPAPGRPASFAASDVGPRPWSAEFAAAAGRRSIAPCGSPWCNSSAASAGS